MAGQLHRGTTSSRVRRATAAACTPAAHPAAKLLPPRAASSPHPHAASPLGLVVQAGGGVQVHHLVVLGRQVVPRALQVRHLGRRGQMAEGTAVDASWAGEAPGQREARLPVVGLPVAFHLTMPITTRTPPASAAALATAPAAAAPHLHEVARHQCLADVGVVVAAVEVGGAQLDLQPRADADLWGRERREGAGWA